MAEITPPQNSEVEQPKSFYIVRASSPDDLKLEWILITTIPVTTGDEACKIVEIYRRRWIIEEGFAINYSLS